MQAQLRVHPTKLAGATVESKLKLLRDDLTGENYSLSASKIVLGGPTFCQTAMVALIVKGLRVRVNNLCQASGPPPAEHRVGAVLVVALD